MKTGFCCENLKENEFERPRCRWGNNIRIDIQEIWWKGVDRINLAQEIDEWRAAVNAVMNIGVHKMRDI